MGNQGNYRRTVAGSVGAGMGALFNGSGRTYYILEHKTQSQYHNIGESQKIIIDQIEMGRDSSCQVRWEDTPQFEMVSRRHAAIIRDGNNWELVHLSTSNPTLVNGRPIQGHYYLQSGDEIQLAANGPRMGFIVPQGKQAFTSSIRLTERMNLFRQQALAPYKKALWAMGILLILVILGFGGWNYKLTQDNNKLMAQATELMQQSADLDKQIAQLEEQIKKNPEDEQLKNKLADLSQQSRQVRSSYVTIVQGNPQLQDKIKELEEKIAPKPDPEPGPGPEPVEPQIKEKPSPVVTDARGYYSSMYRIIVENINVTDRNGNPVQSGINPNAIDCGMGWVMQNGTFVTARQNIQPWLYVDGKTPQDSWRWRLALLYSFGYDISFTYSAYSTSGTGQKMTFHSRDFGMPTGGDIHVATITVSEADLKYIEAVGIAIDKEKLLREGLDLKQMASSARAYATFNSGRAGIPGDAGASNDMAGNTPLTVVYYTTNNVQALAGSVNYMNVNTSGAATNGGTIRLQQSVGTSSALGAPVFIRESDGSLRAVGLYVGGTRVIPISRLR